MAKYIGLLSADARGKLGGLILSRGQGATTLKAHRHPKHPGSSAQLAQQSRMSAALGAWRALTQPEQQSWVTAAAQFFYTNSLGTTYSPTGLQLWTQAYINSSRNFLTPPGTYPPFVVPPAPIMSLEINSPGYIMGITAFGVSGAYAGMWILSMGRVLSPSQNYLRSLPVKWFDITLGATMPGQGPTYARVYGALPQSGDRVLLRALPIDPTTYVSGALLATFAIMP